MTRPTPIDDFLHLYCYNSIRITWRITMERQHAQAFGQYLKGRREALGLTTRALAALAKVNQATVVRLEAGAIAEPRPAKLRRLAEALELKPSETFALAGYARASDLPALPVYLRSKYRDLTAIDIEQIETYVSGVLDKRLEAQTTMSMAGLVAEGGQL